MTILKRLPAASFLAVALSVVFVVLQAPTLDYGTRINDLPHIRDYKVASDVSAGSSLDRETVVTPQGLRVARPVLLQNTVSVTVSLTE